MNQHDSWFGVELRHLAALSAVAREGSFGGAADSLGYVQSAVSQQVLRLERLVGARLVERSRGSREIHVTPEGELLVAHAEEILARVQAARADLTSRAEPDRLRVGVSPGAAAGLLPAVLRELAARAPERRVEPVESASEAALSELVADGKVDVAFAELPLPPAAFESRTILRDPCVLLAAADSDWAGRVDPTTVERLAEAPLVVLEGARSTAALEQWFAAQGATPNVVLRASSDVTLRAIVAAGLGVAVVPRLSVEPSDVRVVTVDLEGLVPERQIAIYWQRGRREQGALEVAVGVAREVCERQAIGELRPVELAAA